MTGVILALMIVICMMRNSSWLTSVRRSIHTSIVVESHRVHIVWMKRCSEIFLEDW